MPPAGFSLIAAWELGPWSLFDVWNEMGPFVRGLFVLLSLMLCHVLYIFNERRYRYALARIQSCTFIARADPLLLANQLAAVVQLSLSYPRSHLAQPIGCAIREFISTPLSPDQKTSLALSAFRRNRYLLCANLDRGLPTLTLIAKVAPFFGLLGTVVGIINSFGGYDMEKSTVLALIARNLSQSLVPNGFGLFVAILASWAHQYLVARSELLKVEMTNAASELETYLNRMRDSKPDEPRLHLQPSPTDPVLSWQVEYDREFILQGAFIIFVLHVLYLTVWLPITYPA